MCDIKCISVCFLFIVHVKGNLCICTTYVIQIFVDLANITFVSLIDKSKSIKLDVQI